MNITKYNISYKTFDQLMYDIEDDLESYSDQGKIIRDKYIKKVQWCNSRLGLKINPEKETVVEIKNGKGKLPEDFKLLDFAFICAKTKTVQVSSTTYTEYNTEIPVLPYNSIRQGCNTCTSSSFVCDTYNLNCTPYQVWKKSKQEYVEIYAFAPIQITPTSLNKCSSSICPNLHEHSHFYFNIEKEGDCYYIKTNLEDTEIYVRYTAQMLDDDNNILILDNPLVLPFYEYAIKESILEDLWLNGLDIAQKHLQLIIPKGRIARREAESFVNLSDFADLKSIYLSNRRKMYNKYIKSIE
jgi:hypothetical protein